MGYARQNFTSGQTLTAQHLNNIENGIVANEAAIAGINSPGGGVNNELVDIIKGTAPISITDLSSCE